MENKPGNNISLKEVKQLEMLNQSFMEYDEICRRDATDSERVRWSDSKRK